MASVLTVDHDRIEHALRPRLGTHAAAACCSTLSGQVDDLPPMERIAVSGAVMQRQREFAAGRFAARLAMRRLGMPASEVPANPDRSPRWPAGLVGSISHCRCTCLALVARSDRWSSVGVDVEPDGDLPGDLWPSICTPDELGTLSSLPEHDRGRWVTRVFSAKEAYYKWVYSQIHTLLDFQDVVIDLDATLQDTRFRVRPLHPQARNATPPGLEGSLITSQGLVLSVMLH